MLELSIMAIIKLIYVLHLRRKDKMNLDKRLSSWAQNNSKKILEVKID